MSDSLRSSNGVLLVEDDTARLTICSTLNNRLALPVTIAQTVDEAVDSMRKEGPFAIVIIDIMMTPGHFTGEKPVSPLEAGYRLAEKIRDGSIDGSKTAAAVPIIFVTGVSSQSMVEKCKTIFKPENVFTKPLPPEKIVTRIRQILDKKCLVLCRREDSWVVEKLGRITPFVSVEEVFRANECLDKLATTKYAALVVLTNLSSDEEQELKRRFHSRGMLVRPKLGPDLPKQLATFCT